MHFLRKLSALAAVSVSLLALGAACSSDDGETAGAGAATSSGGVNTSGGSSGASGGTTSGGTGGSTSIGGSSGNLPTISPDGTALCGDAICQCSNGIDDDDDGDVDGFDVECQGPLDNDEGSFATGIPGDNKDGSWLDCFFDGNSGAGDDGCKYPPECLTGELDANGEECDVSQACKDFCGARTPNGCDCFGCCTIELEDGGTLDILTTSGCSIEEIDDEGKCPRCTKTSVCENTCGECELCPGRDESDLPETCQGEPPAGGAPGEEPPTYTCDGAQVCSADLPCPTNYYCSLGCCFPVVK